MTVSITSRYRGAEVFDAPAAGGTRATVAIRRYAPPAGVDYQHRVTGVETIEYLSWRFLGASEQWWRIADANPLTFPLDWRPGASIAVPATEQSGSIRRDRIFG